MGNVYFGSFYLMMSIYKFNNSCKFSVSKAIDNTFLLSPPYDFNLIQ